MGATGTLDPRLALVARRAALVFCLANAALVLTPAARAAVVTWKVAPRPFTVLFDAAERVLTRQAGGLTYALGDGTVHRTTVPVRTSHHGVATVYVLGTDEAGRVGRVTLQRSRSGVRAAWSIEPSERSGVCPDGVDGRARPALPRRRRATQRGRPPQADRAVEGLEGLPSNAPATSFLSSAGYGVSINSTSVGSLAFPGAVDGPAFSCQWGTTPCPVQSNVGATQICERGSKLSYTVFGGSFPAVQQALTAGGRRPVLPRPSEFELIKWRDAVAGPATSSTTCSSCGRAASRSAGSSSTTRGRPASARSPSTPPPSRIRRHDPGAPRGGRAPDAVGLAARRPELRGGQGLRAGCPGRRRPVGDRPHERRVARRARASARGSASPGRRGVQGGPRRRGRPRAHAARSRPRPDSPQPLPGALRAGRGRRSRRDRPRAAAGDLPRRLHRLAADLVRVLGGDQTGDDHGLRAAIRSAATAGLGGYSTWGSDIGGYLSQSLRPDVFIRWAQLGAVSPIFEVGGRGPQARFWQFGTPTTDLFRTFAVLHYELFPYLYGLACRAHATGIPVLRPLAFGYPDDPAAWKHELELLVGDDLLAAPVDRTGSTVDFPVYLPRGRWTDVFDGRERAGGRTVVRRTPLAELPLYLRSGSAIRFNLRAANVWRRPWQVDELERTGRTGWLYAPGGRRPRAPSPPPRRGTRSACSSPAAPGRRRCSCSGEGGRRRSRIDGRHLPPRGDLRPKTAGWRLRSGSMPGVLLKVPAGGRVTIEWRRS